MSFNSLTEFYTFLKNNKAKFQHNTSLMNFITSMRFIENNSNCSCTIGYKDIATDIYKKILEITSEDDRKLIKQCLNNEQVSFYLDNILLFEL